MSHISHIFHRTKTVALIQHRPKQLNLLRFRHHPIITIQNLNHNHQNLSSPTLQRYYKFCSSKTPPDIEQFTENQTPNPHPTAQSITREQIQRAFRRAQRWFTIRILMFVGVIVGAAVFAWDHPNELINLKNRVATLFSDVGTSTLSQKDLQIQATEYSKQMIKDVFNDTAMQQQTKQFFIAILSEEDFLNTVSELLRDLFQRQIMIESVKQLVINVFNDESVIEQCKILVGHAISAEENKRILLQVIHDIFDNKELKDHMDEIATDTVKGVLNDEDVKIMSVLFLKHILNDNEVQQSSSDSLYKVFMGAMTPSIFKKKKKLFESEGEIEHVKHEHFEMEMIELEKKGGSVMMDSEEDLRENMEIEQQNVMDIEQEQIQEIEEHVDSIESVIGNHQ